MRNPGGQLPPSDDAVAEGPSPRALTRFLRFAAVGASGVVVNTLLLLLLVERLHVPLLLASVLSIEVSTVSNWALNRTWTWRDRGGGWASFGRYHAVAVGGMAIQWTILGLSTSFLHVHYLVGSLIGVGAATAWNFLGNDRLAFALQDGPSSRLRRATWYATALLVQLAIAAVMTHPWDTFVFQKSVTDFLTTGITPYQVASAAPGYIYPGGSLPITAQWYAYPPLPLLLMSATYWPAAYGMVTAPWAARVLLKLPFLLGTLGFAWATRKLIATAPGADADVAARQADRAERWLLLNPLFLVIAGVWGQFEALLLMLVILSVLAIRTERWLLGGAAYGAALLLKIFPVYLGPLLLIHLVRKSGWRASILYFLAAGLVFAAITLPFYLVDPHGTIQQVFLMHAQRPPARFAPVAALFVASQWLVHWPGAPSVDALASAFGRLSFAVTAILLTALVIAYARRPASERNFLLFLGLSMTGGLLATKVFNEQYTLLPLGLLAVVRYHPEAPTGRPWPQLGTLLSSGTWAMFAACLLDNFHIVTYLPPDMAAQVLHTTAPVATRRVASALGLPLSYFVYILSFAVRCALMVPLYLAMRALGDPVREGLAAMERAVARVPVLLRGTLSSRTVLGLVAFAAFVILPISAALSGSPAVSESSAATTPDLPQHAVLAEMRTDWYNPANDPGIASGTWQGVRAVPAAGYYNSNAHKAADDLVALRRAGVDAVLIKVDPDYPAGTVSVRAVAEGIGMPYALSIDLGTIAENGHVPLDDATARNVRVLVTGPYHEWWTGRWLLRVDGHPILAVSGADLVSPAYTSAEHRFVLGAYADAHGLSLSDPALLAAAAAPPLSAADLAGDGAIPTLWRAAYAGAVPAWWAMALSSAPADVGLVSDTPLPAGASSVWLGDSSVDQPAALDGIPAGQVRWATLEGPLNADSLRPAWLKALWAEPSAVVFPWNDFAHERAVEPSKAEGDVLLRATAEWAYAFHHPERPAPTSSTPAGPEQGLPPLPPPVGPWPEGVQSADLPTTAQLAKRLSAESEPAGPQQPGMA